MLFFLAQTPAPTPAPVDMWAPLHTPTFYVIAGLIGIGGVLVMVLWIITLIRDLLHGRSEPAATKSELDQVKNDVHRVHEDGMRRESEMRARLQRIEEHTGEQGRAIVAVKTTTDNMNAQLATLAAQLGRLLERRSGEGAK